MKDFLGILSLIVVYEVFRWLIKIIWEQSQKK